MLSPPAKPVYDKIYKADVIPWRCECCNKCWLYVSNPPNCLGNKIGTCVHGGPYKGYVNATKDPPPEASEDAK